jgi:hypothetical protein
MTCLLSMGPRFFLAFETLSTLLKDRSQAIGLPQEKKGGNQKRTSHLRSNVAVFVNAFFERRISASFLAAIKTGSEESSDDRCKQMHGGGEGGIVKIEIQVR